MRKEQKIVETSIKNNSNFEDERAYQLISDGRVNKGREEGSKMVLFFRLIVFLF